MTVLADAVSVIDSIDYVLANTPHLSPAEREPVISGIIADWREQHTTASVSEA